MVTKVALETLEKEDGVVRPEEEETAVSPFHKGIECRMVIQNCATHFAEGHDRGVDDIKELNEETVTRMMESFYQCAQCHPDYQLCAGCGILLNSLIAELAAEETPTHPT